MCRFWRKRSPKSTDPQQGMAARVSTSSIPVNSQTPRSISRRSVSPRSPSSPTSNVSTRIDQPKDDASIIRLFSLIDNSITDHVLNYYISSNNGSDKFSHFGSDKKELEWVLRASPSTLKDDHIQVIVIRAIINYEIFKAIQDGYFIPPPSRSAGEKEQALTDPKRRISYFQSLTTSQQYHQHRGGAIDKLANDILRMTQPLAASADPILELARLRNLKAIAENAAEFALTIGKQIPRFAIVFPSVNSAPRASGPVSQSNSRRTRNSGSDELYIPVLVPELRKYGNEQGKNYDQFITLVPVQRLPELS